MTCKDLLEQNKNPHLHMAADESIYPWGNDISMSSLQIFRGDLAYI